MHTRLKPFSVRKFVVNRCDPWKYGEYLCIFPAKIHPIYALKWKLGTLCITSKQDCRDMAYTKRPASY
jgi:hypothetical protein